MIPLPIIFLICAVLFLIAMAMMWYAMFYEEPDTVTIVRHNIPIIKYDKHGMPIAEEKEPSKKELSPHDQFFREHGVKGKHRF